MCRTMVEVGLDWVAYGRMVFEGLLGAWRISE